MRDPHDLTARIAQLRQSLAVVRPDLADLPITLALHTEQSNPSWQRASAFVGDHWVAKFSWTDAADERLRSEIGLRGLLGSPELAIPIPEIIAAVDDPPLLISRFVPGSPVTGPAIAASSPVERRQLASSVAGTLHALHAPGVLARVQDAGLSLGAPTPQADTRTLRERFASLVDDRRSELVARWLDWVDGVLAEVVDRPVFLHGDFHGLNLVVDEHNTVRAVLDLEEAAMGDRHYDFRYLPAQEATLELFSQVAADYQWAAGSRIDPRRVMAWHVRTVLGDALWRTESGVALPERGTPRAWVDDLRRRFATLGIET